MYCLTLFNYSGGVKLKFYLFLYGHNKFKQDSANEYLKEKSSTAHGHGSI